LVLPMAPFCYRTIRGIDFYDAMRAHLTALPHVQWLKATVIDVADAGGTAVVHTADGGSFRGTWVYDSRFRYTDLARQPGRYRYLAQHFVGWEIETNRDVFDPAIATLFDFRTPQHGQMRFQYILPRSRRQALVEFTLFSANLLEPESYTTELRRYLREEHGLKEADYRITFTESGVIPMTDHPLPAHAVGCPRVVQIGSRGGASKPSTGFTFRRIQQRTAAIVEALAQTGVPHVPDAQWARRFRLYDAMLLDVISTHGDRAAAIFAQLFRQNPPARLLAFLNEDTSFGAELAVMNSVPWAPFLAALGRQMRSGFPSLKS
jgi:lycopene beta-cyclase